MMIYQGKRVVFLRKLVLWAIVLVAVFTLSRMPRQQIHQVSVAIGHWLSRKEIILLERISINYPKTKPQVVVLPGDADISTSLIARVTQILRTQSLPQIEKSLSLSYLQPISVYLFDTRSGYASGLKRWGIQQAVATTMVTRTNGVANGSVVYIPLYANMSKGSLNNVLTHELTHVVFNQNKIALTIPTWVNEGVAWIEGLRAQASVAKPAEMTLVKRGEEQVLVAFGHKEGIALTSGENAMLRAPYDVELEDYMAVSDLVRKFGWKDVLQYVKGSITEGANASFRRVFAQPINHFITEFQKSLNRSKT